MLIQPYEIRAEHWANWEKDDMKTRIWWTSRHQSHGFQFFLALYRFPFCVLSPFLISPVSIGIYSVQSIYPLLFEPNEWNAFSFHIFPLSATTFLAAKLPPSNSRAFSHRFSLLYVKMWNKITRKGKLFPESRRSSADNGFDKLFVCVDCRVDLMPKLCKQIKLMQCGKYTYH